MDAIYKGALRRHKGSLRKLLIDSKNQEEGESYKWTFNKDHLQFVSSGKMPHLRELGMAIEYKDWHFFLTRLPHMPHLRSLYIIHTRDCPHITQFAPRELANQILNTVILRPEIELCYVGIWNKCFEVLEGTTEEAEGPEVEVPGGVHDPMHSSIGNPPPPPDDSEDEETDDELDEESEAGSEEDIESVATLSDEEQDGPEVPKTWIRLREILFYDDKVAVFRARNAKL